MARILFGLFPAWGHVAPTVAIAQRLQASGHQVLYASHPSMRQLLNRAGLELADSYQTGERVVEAIHLLSRGRAFEVFFRLARLNMLNIYLHDLERGARELVRLTRMWRPHVMVNDILFHAGSLAAEAVGIPYVTSCALVLPRTSRDLPPYGSGFSPSRPDWRWSFWRAVWERLDRHADQKINRVRTVLGLPRTEQSFLSLSPYLCVAYSTAALEYTHRSLPPQVFLVGPSISPKRGDHDIPFPWDWLDGRPLVCVSMGTIFTGLKSFFRKAIEASRGQPWQMVIKQGPAMSPRDWGGVPENVLLVNQQPQVALLQRARVMVSHGGDNSVNEALSAGVPLALVPVGADQRDSAQRVVEAGAGLRLSRRWSSARELQRTIRLLLDDPTYREHAQRIARDFSRCDGPGVSAVLIERLIRTRAPVARNPGEPATVYADGADRWK